MKKFFLTSKGKFIKTSFVLVCAILLSILLMTPLESLNATTRSEVSNTETIDDYCNDIGWIPVDGSQTCDCSYFNAVCLNYIEYRKYYVCGPPISTNEYKTVFTGASIGGCKPLIVP